MTQTLRIATAQYPIDELGTFAAFERKLTTWVEQAAEGGAKLCVFPEYAALELSRIAGRAVSADLGRSIEALQYFLNDYRSLQERLARALNVFILAGSAPVQLTDGRIVNRARLFSPSGVSGYQQKHILTRFEAEQWGVNSSSGLCIFDVGVTKVGIAICYDAEFPLLVHGIAKAGADVVLVPSCTDTLAGDTRVRVACAARAMENQVYVVKSSTVGDAPWCAALDRNVGQAAVFAPPDMSLAPTAIIAEGTLNEPGWVFADLDLDALKRVRESGEVLNRRDWDQQTRLPLDEVKLVDLKFA